MSVKIYEAYRFPLSKISEVTESIREHAIPKATKILSGLVDQLRVQIIEDKALSGDPVPEDRVDSILTWMDASHRLKGLYAEQFSSYTRDWWDLSCHLNAWIHEDFVYAIPYADMQLRDFWDFLVDIPEVEDFAYWDNADEPDDVPYEQFKDRGRVWSEIYTRKLSQPQLIIPIITLDSIGDLDGVKDRYLAELGRE